MLIVALGSDGVRAFSDEVAPVSYNKWTSKLDTLARAMGEEQWSEAREAVGRNGQPIIEPHG